MTSTAQLPVESPEGFRISPQQRRLWRLIERYPGIPFAAQCHVRIIGPLNVDRLDNAILDLRKTHEILRTRLVLLPGSGMPVQVIGDQLAGLDERFDVKDRSSVEADSQIGSIAGTLWNQAQRAGEDQGVNFTLIDVTDREHVLLVTAPGLCADATALAAIVREVRDAYSGKALCENESLQYADIAEWQNQVLEGDARGHDSYWKTPDFSALRFPHLPFGRRNSEPADFNPGVLVRHFPANIVLPAAMGQSGASAEAFLIAAYQALIGRLSNLDQFLIGIRVDGRTPAELRDAIGLFAKSMPVAAVLEDQHFDELVQKVSRALELATYDQAFFDAEAFPSPEPSQRCPTPLIFSALQVAALQPVESTEWEITALDECLEPFELAATATISNGTLKALKFAWDKSVFDEQEIKLLADLYIELLQQVVSDPSLPPGHFTFIDGRLPLLRANALEESAASGVHALIEDQCARVPQRVAAIYGEQQITYAELNQRASLLARRLVKLGAAPDAAIAIFAERSIDFIVGIFAVLKSGGAWLPIDPDTPAERIEYMIERAGAVAVLTDDSVSSRLRQLAIPVIRLDEALLEDGDTTPLNPASPAVFPEQLAYVIFTSGSTGRPKGVAIEHRQLMAYIRGLKADMDLPDGASYALVSTMAADLGHTAVFAALTSGGCLHVIPSSVSRDMTALSGYFLQRPVDCIKIVPAHLEALCQSLPGKATFSWQTLIVGGEPLTWELNRLIKKFAPGSTVVNEYGPTETTVGVIAASAEAGKESFNTVEVPIGHPRAGVSAYVLDQSLRPVPAWVTGDLYIGGDCVGRGYIGANDLTAERFLPDPFQSMPGTRMYVTGDRARYRLDGTLEFLGRRDGQIKLRGYRIELSEIEATLCRHPQVQAAIAMLMADKTGGKSIAAWVAVGQANVPAQELRRFASESLPSYMVPNVFTCVERFKLTANGKVDRQGLPPAAEQAPPKTSIPLDEVEESFLAVWRKVLGRESVNVDDNYFALGGDSLRVVQVVHESRRYGITIRAMDILRYQTIRNLRKALQQERRHELFPNGLPEASLPIPEAISRVLPDIVDAYPVSGIQSFVLEKYAENDAVDGIYHIQECFHLEDPTFSREALEAAFEAVVERHPALRTVFYLKSCPPLQCIRRTLPWKISINDISHLDSSAQDARIAEQVRADRANLFDTANLEAPLFRIVVFLRSTAQFTLLFSCHHAIMDGWGHRIFLNHLVEAYIRIKSGKTPDLGKPDSTYREFVTFEQAVCRSEQVSQFWRSYLSDAPFPPLPESATVGTEEANERIVSVEFAQEQMEAWERMTREHAVSMQALLLAAWLEALREWSGDPLVSTGVISNGRSEYLTDPLSAVGLFWNVAPVISRKKLPLLEQAAVVQKDLVDIQPYASYPLPQLIADNGGQELFYSVFRYLNFWNTKEIPEESGLRLLGGYAIDRYPFALTCTAAAGSSGRYVQIEYNPKAISLQSVKNLLSSYTSLLEQATEVLR